MKDVMPGYEKRKVTLDLFKHMGTLSLAAIAVLVSFLPSLQKLENGKEILESAVVSFGICLIATIITCVILLANLESLPEPENRKSQWLFRFSALASMAFFAWGSIGLCRTLLVNIT